MNHIEYFIMLPETLFKPGWNKVVHYYPPGL